MLQNEIFLKNIENALDFFIKCVIIRFGTQDIVLQDKNKSYILGKWKNENYQKKWGRS